MEAYAYYTRVRYAIFFLVGLTAIVMLREDSDRIESKYSSFAPNSSNKCPYYERKIRYMFIKSFIGCGLKDNFLYFGRIGNGLNMKFRIGFFVFYFLVFFLFVCS